MKKLRRLAQTTDVHRSRASDTRLFWFFVLSGIFLAHYYLYVTVGVHLKWWLEAAWLAAGVCAIASSCAARRLRTPGRERRGMYFKSAVHRFGGVWNIFVALTAVCMLIFRFFPAGARGAFPISCAVSLAICAYGVYEARTIRAVRAELRTAKLTCDRVRIAQVSDLHIGAYMLLRHVARVVSAIVEAEPDMVVITGDLADGSLGGGEGVSAFYLPYADELRRMADASPRLGVWAVPGNHDNYGEFESLSNFADLSRIALLMGEKRDLGDITLLGADDLDHIRKSKENPDRSASEALIASLTPDEEKKVVVLLRHRPVVEPSTVGRFDLQLSGHTHGGQLFSIPSSRHRIPGRPRGLRSLGNGSYLYVSNGAGFVGPPMRFFAPAEIVLIDLIRDESDSV